jgi:hypothetical protein
VLLLVACLPSCGETPPDTPNAAAAGPLAVVRLSVPDATARPTLSVPADSAQVQIRLPGVDHPVELTAELESQATGEVRRWSVDDATAGADGAALAVTVPAYVVPAGDHVLTLWAGDADMVARYRFRVAVP